MLYPLFFEPIYKNIIWGGRNLEKLYGRILPSGNVAESWEICCHKNGVSKITNGIHKGKTLENMLTEYSEELVGKKYTEQDRFPLLVKLIDANDKLSVQVHPNDDYSAKIEGEPGKTEIWYVLHAKEGAEIVYGLKQGMKKSDLAEAVDKGKLEECLNFMPVKKGDAVFIPSGTVHALLDGVVVAEIQQNSDVTYRLFDWNRVSDDGLRRELHIDKALEVIAFEGYNENNSYPDVEQGDYTVTALTKCRYFNIDKLKIRGSYSDDIPVASFVIYTVVEGSGVLCHGDNESPLPLGSSFMIPAKCEPYLIRGTVTLLKTYI